MQMVQTTAGINPAELRQAWHALRGKGPVRNRDAAASLGVSEAELIASECGDGVTRLEGDFRKLVKRLPAVGRVMALTRNESCVHERVGAYEDVSVSGHVGLVLGPDIDLRVFYRQWKFGYAVREDLKEGPRHSLQFYDASGTAIHKVYLRAESNLAAYEAIVADFRAAKQAPGEKVAPPAPVEAECPDSEIDQEGLRAAWAAMKDTHEFFGMLRKFKVSRTQAMRLAEPRFARPLAGAAARKLLESAARSAAPIMIFVGNPGNIQIHTGPVKNIKIMGPWLNVLDPEFNLHLREDHVKSVWVVRKPTADGIVTSVELFDGAGRNIALIFGKRKPGVPEAAEWRALVETLEAENA
jgi:putative hemin transport protein